MELTPNDLLAINEGLSLNVSKERLAEQATAPNLGIDQLLVELDRHGSIARIDVMPCYLRRLLTFVKTRNIGVSVRHPASTANRRGWVIAGPARTSRGMSVWRGGCSSRLPDFCG